MKLTPLTSAKPAELSVPPPPSPFRRIRNLSLASVLLIVVFVFGFGAWSVLAPLQSAVIAQGVAEVETSRKTVQHLEGGIIAEILVAEGDRVAPGQTLIRLDDTQARTMHASLQGQLWDAQARSARLRAERDNLAEIPIPAGFQVTGLDVPAAAEILAAQKAILHSRRQLLDSRVAVIRQRIAKLDEEIIGLEAQAQAADDRAAIIDREIAAVRPLFEKGLTKLQRLLSLEREKTEIKGRQGELLAHIARAHQAIEEAEAEILRLKSDDRKEIDEALREAQKEAFSLMQNIQAASDVLKRTEVRSPEAGTVTDLRVHTPGGVVEAGQPLMDLVPDKDQLIMSVQVRPEDIDLIRSGLEAQVRLLSYRLKRVPSVDGILTYVSADRQIDDITAEPFYEAKIALDEETLKKVDNVQIIPGMPIEALINTGDWTLADYLLSPLIDSFNRAFRDR